MRCGSSPVPTLGRRLTQWAAHGFRDFSVCWAQLCCDLHHEVVALIADGRRSNYYFLTLDLVFRADEDYKYLVPDEVLTL